MDTRISRVTNWYNHTLEVHRQDRQEFNNRFGGSDSRIDLEDPAVARQYGRLEREGQILDQLGAILQSDLEVIEVPENDSPLD